MCFTAFALSFDIMHIIFYFGWLAGSAGLIFRLWIGVVQMRMRITNDNEGNGDNDDDDDNVAKYGLGTTHTLEPTKPIQMGVNFIHI